MMLMSRESVNWVETNEYMWFKGHEPFAMLRGKWTSNTFGHQTVRVRDMSGKEVFMIRNSKNVWNPFSLRYSFRIHPPGDKEGVWYTINKDAIGRGFAGMRQEWRVYRGKERDNQMVYYCVGSYGGWSYTCYKSQSDYDMSLPPIAWTEQEMNAGDFFTDFSQWLPDHYRLYTKTGCDSALILALSTVIDMCNDARDRASKRKSERLSKSNMTGNRSDGMLVKPHDFDELASA